MTYSFLFIVLFYQTTGYNVLFTNYIEGPNSVIFDVIPTHGLEDWTIAPYRTMNVSVGDKVVFNYVPAVHDVIRFNSSSAYEQCTVRNASSFTRLAPRINNVFTFVNFTWTVDREGPNFFACSISTHCAAGMKITINAQGTAITPKTHIVQIYGPYWGVLGYPNITLIQGDSLKFLSDPFHNLARYAQANDYAACNPSNATFTELISWTSVSSQVVAFDEVGTHYLACTVEDGLHCRFGMKFVVTVLPRSNLQQERDLASRFAQKHLQTDPLIMDLLKPNSTVNFPQLANTSNNVLPTGQSNASAFFKKWQEVLHYQSSQVDYVTASPGRFVLGISGVLKNTTAQMSANVKDVIVATIEDGYVSSLTFAVDTLVYSKLLSTV